jgi:hypothetical protein
MKTTMQRLIFLAVFILTACSTFTKPFDRQQTILANGGDAVENGIDLLAMPEAVFPGEEIVISVVNNTDSTISINNQTDILLYGFNHQKRTWEEIAVGLNSGEAVDEIKNVEPGKSCIISFVPVIGSSYFNTSLYAVILATIDGENPKKVGNSVRISMKFPDIKEIDQVSLTKQMDTIHKVAKSWHQDSFLVWYTVYIPEKDNGSRLIAKTTYQSSSEPNSQLEINLYRDLRMDQGIYTEPNGLPHYPELNKKNWTIDVSEAFVRFANEDSAITWPSPDHQCNFLTLSHAEQSQTNAVWTFQFSDCKDNIKTYRMDAVTGEIFTAP